MHLVVNGFVLTVRSSLTVTISLFFFLHLSFVTWGGTWDCVKVVNTINIDRGDAFDKCGARSGSPQWEKFSRHAKAASVV